MDLLTQLTCTVGKGVRKYDNKWLITSCGTVYNNRSCLWVCVCVAGRRALSEPYYSQRTQCLHLSERFFHYDCGVIVQRISDTITYQFTFDGRFSRVLVLNVVCDDRMLAEELDMMRQNSGDNGQHSFFQTVIVIG